MLEPQSRVEPDRRLVAIEIDAPAPATTQVLDAVLQEMPPESATAPVPHDDQLTQKAAFAIRDGHAHPDREAFLFGNHTAAGVVLQKTAKDILGLSRPALTRDAFHGEVKVAFLHRPDDHGSLLYRLLVVAEKR
jgi:hypothetical protein